MSTNTVELVPISEGNLVLVKPNESVIIGRGTSLGCNDKKISRQHAELIFKNDGTLYIKPTHINPVFYRPLNGKTIQLAKGVEQELKDGDQFGLLPTTFFFRIQFSKDNIENPNDEADQQTRKLPTWMATSNSSNHHTTAKRKLSSDEDKITKIEKKSSDIKSVDSEDDKSFDSVPTNKTTSKEKRRAICPYGTSCYRKNPNHRTEQSHPGDSDYEDDTKTDGDKKDDEKPSCPYGKTCYRQNLQHRNDFKH